MENVTDLSWVASKKHSKNYSKKQLENLVRFFFLPPGSLSVAHYLHSFILHVLGIWRIKHLSKIFQEQHKDVVYH